MQESFYLGSTVSPVSLGSTRFAILNYLLTPKYLGLSISSLRIHLAAIAAYPPPIQGRIIFSHPTVARFLKVLMHVFPYSGSHPLPGTSTVLSGLMEPPFEHLATFSFYL